MVPGYGPFRERFEEYTLERTANHPSLVPRVMLKLDKVCFRLAFKDTLDGTAWSSWLEHAALDEPQRVLLAVCGISFDISRENLNVRF